MPASADGKTLFLADSHCHLQDRRFEEDRQEVLQRARDGGVRAVVVPGNDLATSRAGLELASREPDVFATVGVHPHDTRKLDRAGWEQLEQMARSGEAVAIGETGLDYHYDNSPREVQQEAFRGHVALARQLGLPVVVHSREAEEDTMRILEETGAREVGGVLHCFSGGQEMARQGLDMGFYISVAGPVTFPKARTLHRVVENLPLDALLVETDAPYLAPIPRRGKRNEPALVRYVAEAVARLQGVDAERLARAAAANTGRLFGLPLSWQDASVF